jgi:aminopeptidase
MPDPRIEKLADVLIHYSLELKPGQKLHLRCSTLAEELALAAYAKAIQAGAHVFFNPYFPQIYEIRYKYASDEQLDFASPVSRLLAETFDALLSIGAEQNTHELSNINPERQTREARAYHPINKIFFDRAARKEAAWCYTEYPTHATAQDASMSLGDYQNFVYTADKLDEPDPVAAWQAFGAQMRKVSTWLTGKDQVVFKGKDIDLSFSIKGRSFEVADGKYNMPDGEIFTGPVEDSAQGWIHFRYPAIMGGREVAGIELYFEDGRAVKETAVSGQEYLTTMLNSDAGARYLGEWGLGLNYSIPRYTKNILFDEKLGNTIHLALGESYPETGGKNESAIHWDMVCDMSDAEIWVDDELFYKDGKPVMWEER